MTETVRFPAEILDRVDEVALELAKIGILIKRSATIRLLIERALKDKKDG